MPLRKMVDKVLDPKQWEFDDVFPWEREATAGLLLRCLPDHDYAILVQEARHASSSSSKVWKLVKNSRGNDAAAVQAIKDALRARETRSGMMEVLMHIKDRLDFDVEAWKEGDDDDEDATVDVDANEHIKSRVMVVVEPHSAINYWCTSAAARSKEDCWV